MILNYLHLDVLLKVDQATKGEVPVKCLWLLSICRYVICTTSKYPRFLEKLFLYYYVDMEPTCGIVPTIIIHFY